MKWSTGAALLLATMFLWLRITGAARVSGRGADVDAEQTLAAFERVTPPALEIDLAERYGGRLELVDPRRALPTWHLHDTTETLVVHDAMRTCSGAPVPAIADAELTKAFAWHAAFCRGDVAAEDALVTSAPFLHPSGRSYARLALDRSPRPSREWVRAHARFFHVTELAELAADLDDADDRALASLSAGAWRGILEADAIVLAPRFVVRVTRNAYGPGVLSLRSRAAWDAHAARASVELVRRGPACAEPVSSVLCLRREPAPEGLRTKLRILLASAGIVFGAGITSLLLLFVRTRREADRERMFLLRTLTHELRTPATGLRLDIEPLLGAFDDLPADCQEPFLRLAAGIERLSRVLEVTGRALALFEAKRKSDLPALALEMQPSARAWFEELREEWPEDVTLAISGDDFSFTTDVAWLRVAVRNLVENAVRHGVAPVQVCVQAEEGDLVVRVADAGKTPDFSLAHAKAPFRRRAGSPGLGLGLAICDRVASLLGGRLRHEPDPTTFELRVPLAGKK